MASEQLNINFDSKKYQKFAPLVLIAILGFFLYYSVSNYYSTYNQIDVQLNYDIYFPTETEFFHQQVKQLEENTNPFNATTILPRPGVIGVGYAPRMSEIELMVLFDEHQKYTILTCFLFTLLIFS